MSSLSPGRYEVVEINASFGTPIDNIDPLMQVFASVDGNTTQSVISRYFQVKWYDGERAVVEVSEDSGNHPVLFLPYGSQNVVYRSGIRLPSEPGLGGQEWEIEQGVHLVSGYLGALQRLNS